MKFYIGIALVFVFLAALSAQAQLSEAEIAQIRAQAEQQGIELYGGGDSQARRKTRDASPFATPKLFSGIESNLRKIAAKEALKRQNARTGRRLLSDTVDLGFAFDGDIEIDSVTFNSGRALLQAPGIRPTPDQALPSCTIQESTILEGSTLPDGSPPSITNAGDCCAACYFRLDCVAWTFSSDPESPGCFLRGSDYRSSSRANYVAGIMSLSSLWTPPPYPVPPKPLVAGPNKYSEVLKLTRFFIEAQKSGEIQLGGPVPWRSSSNMEDPVVGGWYNGASTLKESFPMASSLSFMAWGMLTFGNGYRKAGVYEDYLSTLRNSADYLVRCYDEQARTFVGQIGDPRIELAYWGRPEDETGTRPQYIWTPEMHASDMLSSVSAAWVATSLLLRSRDPAAADVLLSKARSIYALAISNEGKYSDYFKEETAGTFPSTDFLDDQAWAAAWLWRATREQQYLTDAQSFWDRSFGDNPFNTDVWPSWDSKWAPTAALMRQNYRAGARGVNMVPFHAYFNKMFLPAWFKADGTLGVIKTPQGMAYPGWNTINNLQFPTTAAMVALQDSVGNPNKKQKKEEIQFARDQINYALGFQGRSFVTGWGGTPPASVRHAGASCPDSPVVCDKQNYYEKSVNPHVLYGALVGGPMGVVGNAAAPDCYVDVRTDWKSNEPTIDTVSGFSGAVAALAAL